MPPRPDYAPALPGELIKNINSWAHPYGIQLDSLNCFLEFSLFLPLPTFQSWMWQFSSDQYYLMLKK